jgi:hypothetical protein
VSADAAARITDVETEAVANQAVEALSPTELRALREAAAWYAKYHQRIIADVADDRSAAGAARRRHFDDLYAALAKLGLKLARPVGLSD